MRPRCHALAVELTSYCNQKCTYCYNAWREDGGKSVGSLPAQELLQVLAKALVEVDFDHVTLTGGEPFARADFFDVMDLCRHHKVPVQIISNGGLVTEALAARLAPYRPMFVQVTLNGDTRELHEAHVGAGHYDGTLRGIATLRRHGVHVCGCIVVTRRNARVVGEILHQLRSMDVVDIALSRFSPAGYAAQHVAELLPSRRDMLSALEQAEASACKLGLGIQVTMPVPPCVIEHSDYPHVRFSFCPIGTDKQEFALGPRGELRSCTLHTGAIGDAKTESLADLVQAPSVLHYRDVTPEFCAPCPYRGQCMGGCGAAAGSVFGNIKALDPFVAQHVDESFRGALARARTEQAGLVPASRLRARTASTRGERTSS